MVNLGRIAMMQKTRNRFNKLAIDWNKHNKPKIRMPPHEEFIRFILDLYEIGRIQTIINGGVNCNLSEEQKQRIILIEK